MCIYTLKNQKLKIKIPQWRVHDSTERPKITRLLRKGYIKN